MTTEVRLPQLPESVADATLVTWHKQVGDTVVRDENLADLDMIGPEQALGDLPVRPALRDEAQHLVLPAAEPERVARRP